MGRAGVVSFGSESYDKTVRIWMWQPKDLISNAVRIGRETQLVLSGNNISVMPCLTSWFVIFQYIQPRRIKHDFDSLCLFQFRLNSQRSLFRSKDDKIKRFIVL